MRTPHRPLLLLLFVTTGCGPVLNVADALHRCDDRLPDVQDDPEAPMHRMTVTDTDAHCNDGSPPVIAIQAATDVEHQNDWIVYMEPGSYCATGQDCIDRWCGNSPPYSAKLMSSDFFPEHYRAGGLLDDRAANPTEGWNKVYLHYCSSDSWLGTRTEEVVLRDGSPNISLWFQGDQVVQAQLDALDAGALSDDGQVQLPSLADADRILFAGASAGATGLMHHIDRFADRYPDVDVRASFDGISSVDKSLLDDSERSRALKVDDTRWSTIYADPFNARTDPDCAGARCIDDYLVYRDAVQTPFSFRDDVQDPNMLRLTRAYGLADDRAGKLLSQTASRLAAARPGDSVLESACKLHVITDNASTYEMKVDGVSQADMVDQMWKGERIAIVDTWPGTLSDCP